MLLSVFFWPGSPIIRLFWNLTTKLRKWTWYWNVRKGNFLVFSILFDSQRSLHCLWQATKFVKKISKSKHRLLSEAVAHIEQGHVVTCIIVLALWHKVQWKDTLHKLEDVLGSGAKQEIIISHCIGLCQSEVKLKIGVGNFRQYPLCITHQVLIGFVERKKIHVGKLSAWSNTYFEKVKTTNLQLHPTLIDGLLTSIEMCLQLKWPLSLDGWARFNFDLILDLTLINLEFYFNFTLIHFNIIFNWNGGWLLQF